MLELLKASFLVLLFSYYAVMIFLMMLSVILMMLYMLMLLLYPKRDRASVDFWQQLELVFELKASLEVTELREKVPG